MAHVVQIIPSVTLVIVGGGTVTLKELQSFIDQSKELGVAMDKELSTTIEAPTYYDQRDSSPGGFTIVARQ